MEKDVAYEKCPRAVSGRKRNKSCRCHRPPLTAAPVQMLKFYEERLRFRTPNEPDGANPM